MAKVGRKPLYIDMTAFAADCAVGMTLQQLADRHSISVSTAFSRKNAVLAGTVIPAPAQDTALTKGQMAAHKAWSTRRANSTPIGFTGGDDDPADCTHLQQPPQPQLDSEGAVEDPKLISAAAAKKIILSGPPPERQAFVHLPETVDEAFARINEHLGYKGIPPMPASPRPKKPDGMTKIMVMGDLHIPQHHLPAIKKAIMADAADTDVLVVPGDWWDFHSVSRYAKYEVVERFTSALAEGKALLDYFSSVFPKVVMFHGNHDERLKKHVVALGASLDLMAGMGLMSSWLLPDKNLHGDNRFHMFRPLNYAAYNLKNVEIVQPYVKDFAQFGFFHQIGDTIFSHAEKFSRVPGKAANDALSWYRDVAGARGLNLIKPFNLLVQAHTHQASLTWSNGGYWAMESGCLCRTPDYAADPKLRGAPRRSILGYVVLYQDASGRTDMTCSRFIPIEDED